METFDFLPAEPPCTPPHPHPPVLPTVDHVDADPLCIGCIRVTWNRVHGADGYAVFRSAAASGVYLRLACIDGACFFDGDLPADTTWFYRVAAIFGPHTGPQSAFAAATTNPDCCCRCC